MVNISGDTKTDLLVGDEPTASSSGGKPTAGPPFWLLGNRIVFTNWTFVFQGYSRWEDQKGRNVSVVGDLGPTEARLVPAGCNPSGIRLCVHPAKPCGPLLQLDQPWNKGGAIGTLLHDQGVYRAWIATGWGDLQLASPGKRPENAMCYMESRDGYEWTCPPRDTVSFEVQAQHDVVFSTHCFIGGGLTVFHDPVGAPGERYKIAAEWNSWDPEVIAHYERRWPADLDPRAKRDDSELILGILGAVSPDGLHWTVLPEPLVVTHCDTQLVGTYNVHRGEYVVYTREYVDLPCKNAPKTYDAGRMVQYARRAIGATRSRGFRHFPLPELVLQADLSMRPSEVLYTNCYTTIPGAPEHHLMFPAVWDLCHHDETYIRMASSPDGLLWQFLPGDPVLNTGAFGQWDGGCVYTHPNLTELPNGDWVLPYTGYDVPHKYPRVRARRNTGYAVWPKGRLVSLKSDVQGRFETVPVVPPGKKLFINALTRRAGHIRVEALDRQGRPIPGREQSNCVPLFGDLHWAPVCWSHHDDLGIDPGDEVSLRFDLDHAEIFGLEFR